MRIRDIMTKKVIALKPSDTLLHAISVFSKNRISGAPVVHAARRVVGIITEMDILRRLELGSIDIRCGPAKAASSGRGGRATEERGPGKAVPMPERKLRLKSLPEALSGVGALPVSKVMTLGVVTVSPDDLIVEKMPLMVHRRVRRLPVVDRKGVLVGIVSRKDLMRMLEASATTQAGEEA